jgi:hypothetical protein
MSYGRWLECDLYACQAPDRDGRPLFIAHLAASADAFLDRLPWLERKGCSLASHATEALRGGIAEAEARESS